jgi:hypothetical protein
MRYALLFLGVTFTAAAAAFAADPAPINVKTLQPGLHATYSSLAGKETLYRVDAKPALAAGESSPHPRIAPGPFNVVWTGVIQFRGEGPFQFDAFIGGEATVRIDDVVVLQGRGESNSSRIPAKLHSNLSAARASPSSIDRWQTFLRAFNCGGKARILRASPCRNGCSRILLKRRPQRRNRNSLRLQAVSQSAALVVRAVTRTPFPR